MVISALRRKSKFEFRSFLNFFFKFLGFPWCSTREDLSIDVSITNVGLILTKLGWFLFSGYEQMDRRTDRQTRFWNPHMETCRHTKNFNSKLKISGKPSISICLPGGRGCIISDQKHSKFYIIKLKPLHSQRCFQVSLGLHKSELKTNGNSLTKEKANRITRNISEGLNSKLLFLTPFSSASKMREQKWLRFIRRSVWNYKRILG